MKSRKQANIEATRAALMSAARRHFARYGYSRAGTERIAADARVTCGALYHHFAGKKGLFQAVAEEVEGEILAAAAAGGETEPWLRLRNGFERLIDRCAADDVQRIIFVEAPQVVGPDAWREIELRFAFGALRANLATLQEAGKIQPYPIDLIARMLLALLRETSAEVARSGRDPQVRGQISGLVAGFWNILSVS